MKLLYICILILFFDSCNNRQYKKEVQQNSNVRSMPSYLSSYVKKFDLPYDEHIGADSNTLFFYYSGFYDTSFLVHLHKEDTTVLGVLYEILPTYHRDDEDYADKDSRLLFFEGYSFKI